MTQTDPLLCPSAQPDIDGAQLIGVLRGDAPETLRVAYLAEGQPVTAAILALSGAAKPTEVMRFSAPCAGHGCGHFDGRNCKLAARVASMLEPVVNALPPCAIRPTCRWFREQGREACLRCPQVVTDTRTPDATYESVTLGR